MSLDAERLAFLQRDARRRPRVRRPGATASDRCRAPADPRAAATASRNVAESATEAKARCRERAAGERDRAPSRDGLRVEARAALRLEASAAIVPGATRDREDSLRRSIGLPLTIGIVLVLLALGAGGRLERAGRARRRRGPAGRRAALGTHWVLLVAGLALLRAADRRARAALRLAGPRDAAQPAPAGVPRRRDARDEDAARVAAPLPRHARSPRSRRRAAPRSSSPACARTSSGSSAPWTRCSPPRARRARAQRAPRADRAARAARRAASHEMREQYRLAPDALRLEIDGEPRRARRGAGAGLVFRNLLDNAVKYSGPTVEVRVRAAAERPEGACASRSTTAASASRARSCGASSSRFYRAGLDVQRRVKGLGLGLFIVRILVRRQGGRVEATSEGSGAARASWCDCARAAPALGPRRARQAPLAARSCGVSRILVVEDECAHRGGPALQPRSGGPRGRGRGRRTRRARAGARRRPPLRPRDPRPDAARDERLRGRAPRARGGQLRADPDPHREGRPAATWCAASKRAPTTTSPSRSSSTSCSRACARCCGGAAGTRPPTGAAHGRFGEVTVDFDRFELEGPQGKVELTTRETACCAR